MARARTKAVRAPARVRKAVEPAAPVVWRDGIHLVGTPIWCDARRAREVCFASRHDAVPAARHGQLIATAETLALYGDGAAGTGLSAPRSRPFSLGTLRLELVGGGAGLGAAALAVDVGDQRVLYAGAVGRGDGLGGAAEARRADVVVIECGERDLAARMPDRIDAADWVAARWRRARAVGGALIVVVGRALDGLELLAALGGEAGDALAAQRGLEAVALRARALPAGQAVPAVRRAGARIKPGALVLWPAARAAGLARLTLPTGSQRVAVAAAGDALAARLELDAGLRWTMAGDASDALAYLEACSARTVVATGEGGPALAARLGARARALGAPVQMSLF